MSYFTNPKINPNDESATIWLPKSQVDWLTKKAAERGITHVQYLMGMVEAAMKDEEARKAYKVPIEAPGQ